MNTIELTCGTKSFSKVAKARSHSIWTTDIDPIHNPDYVGDMLKEECQEVIFEKKIINIVIETY